MSEQLTNNPSTVQPGINRRTVLTGVGAAALVGVVGAGLAGCSAPPPGPIPPAPAESIPRVDVPVGSGRITGEYVVTQPTAGEFRGYRAICPHQRCKVTVVKQQDIVCQCHGSTFSVVDGSVTGGPSQEPLPTAAITVNGDVIEVGGN